MDAQDLKNRYQQLLEEYHSGKIDWKAFESELFELKRLRASLSASLEAIPILDTKSLEQLKNAEIRKHPNRLDAEGTGTKPGTNRFDSGRTSSDPDSRQHRVDKGRPSLRDSGVFWAAPKPSVPRSTSLQVGNVVGEYYTLQRLLGNGVLGETWRAKDSKTENYIVLKCLPPPIQRSPKAMGRFQDAFRRVAALRHPGICPVYHYANDETHGVFYTSAYLDAIPLNEYYDQYIRSFQSFPITAVVRILWPIAQALDDAKERKVFHRGLKPNNVLLGRSSGVLLTDFWITESIRTSLLELGLDSIVSEGAWRAPEIWTDERYYTQSDQFSLAVLAYQLITGNLPFVGKDDRELRGKIVNDNPPVIETEPDYVNAALFQALAKDPFDRFPSCLHFVKGLIEPTVKSPHFQRPRHLDARNSLWVALFGLPKVEKPTFLQEETPNALWPFKETSRPSGSPDIRIPEQSVYPYNNVDMGMKTSGISTAITTTKLASLLGGIAAVALGAGIVLNSSGIKSDAKQTAPAPKRADSSARQERMEAVRSSNALQGMPALPSTDPMEPTNGANGSGKSGSNGEIPPISELELNELTNQAAKGNVDSLRKLGEMYLDGKGVPVQYENAIRYYRTAAEHGDADSLYQLGRCNELGLGVSISPDLAKNYYTRAAKQGSREAKLAIRRLNGDVP